tara:strand:+ start:62 stop:943 length:882 start_codon:yes stop_codon:yes gene_type:complete
MKYSFLFLFISLISISSCSSSYKELSNKEHKPPSKFTKHLFDQYKIKADFEAGEMHDWDSTKLYSEKALKASNGVNILPEKISYWKLSDKEAVELHKAYENLVTIYDDAINKDPYNLAIAVTSLDCWAEQQEEGWQSWDIKKCKDDFLTAVHKIYSVLQESKNKNFEKKESSESTTLITKNKSDEPLHVVYFDFDKSKLSSVSIDSLKKFLNDNKTNINKFLIVGHTDTKGTKKYNDKLSLERAITIKNILLVNGISEEAINILALGENSLKVQTEDNVAHPANRRAEISHIK